MAKPSKAPAARDAAKIPSTTLKPRRGGVTVREPTEAERRAAEQKPGSEGK